MSETENKKKRAATVEICLWWLARIILSAGVVSAPTTPKRLMVLAALASTFTVSALKKLSGKSPVSGRISYHLQSCICLAAVLGSGIGFGFDAFQKLPEYDIFLNFVGGILGVATGYYISIALRKPIKKKGYYFTVFMSFFISNAFIVVREIAQFFIDYFTGRNLLRCEFVGDDFWLFRLVGPMLSMYEQRPLYDYSIDLVMTVFGAIGATAVLFVYIVIKNKELFRIEKISLRSTFGNFPQKCRDKLLYEADKVRQQTNLADMLLWWCTRVLMIYAFITIENRAEATLMLVVSLGTVAISLLHLITPRESMFCKINYRVQTLLCVIVFLGSFCGNYVQIYYITGRFDTLLHFMSGFISTVAGYYIALTLVKPGKRNENTAICLFAVAFSMTVIPIHEMIEFFGDYIWGTCNQGFMWEPEEDVLIYRLFGKGAGNELLIRIYDSMYDMVLATTSSIISFFALMIAFERKGNKAITQKETVKC